MVPLEDENDCLHDLSAVYQHNVVDVLQWRNRHTLVLNVLQQIIDTSSDYFIRLGSMCCKRLSILHQTWFNVLQKVIYTSSDLVQCAATDHRHFIRLLHQTWFNVLQQIIDTSSDYFITWFNVLQKVIYTSSDLVQCAAKGYLYFIRLGSRCCKRLSILHQTWFNVLQKVTDTSSDLVQCAATEYRHPKTPVKICLSPI